MNKKIAITAGDHAGIGPEIILKALNTISNTSDILLIGNKEIFDNLSTNLNIKLPDNIEFINIQADLSRIKTGINSAESGNLSFHSLTKACELASKNIVRAIVTAPTSKTAINMAGYDFNGQTEILQKYLAEEKNLQNKAEMLFVSRDFRVLLLTRHIPLADVTKNLTREKIIESISALHNSLKNDFKINNPKLAICGLNPHAGEDGLIGKEEKDVIMPSLDILKRQYNICVEGPFPADTMWIKAANPYLNNNKQPYDAYISCYHDQGLIPIKLLALNSTVNTTINLPIIRTSPSHGTAFDIAGKNIANFESMLCAIKLADDLSK